MKPELGRRSGGGRGPLFTVKVTFYIHVCMNLNVECTCILLQFVYGSNSDNLFLIAVHT